MTTSSLSTIRPSAVRRSPARLSVRGETKNGMLSLARFISPKVAFSTVRVCLREDLSPHCSDRLIFLSLACDWLLAPPSLLPPRPDPLFSVPDMLVLVPNKLGLEPLIPSHHRVRGIPTFVLLDPSSRSTGERRPSSVRELVRMTDNSVFASLTDFQEEDAPTPPAALGVPGSPDPLALFSEDGICLDPYELDTGLRKQVTPARDLTGCVRAPPLETCEAMGPVSMHLTEEVSAMHGTAVILTPPSDFSPPYPTDANRNAIPDVWAELDLIDQLISDRFYICYHFCAVDLYWVSQALNEGGVAAGAVCRHRPWRRVGEDGRCLGFRSCPAASAMVKEQAAERYIQIPHTILRKDLAIVCTVLQTKVYWPVSTTKQRITDYDNSLLFGYLSPCKCTRQE
uniref:(California timema) hypothetical protein n=1 Tax=Timema californicum TaxID=61474 RepID=A0A7R9JBC3_TIMCA|nr:unnamed protein product [Timema californicum]